MNRLQSILQKVPKGGETYNLNMKIHPDTKHSTSITAYGAGWVAVGGQKVTSSFIVSTEVGLLPWDCARFEDLTLAHFEQIAQMDMELLIFGSGYRIRFPAPALMLPFYRRQLGVETMDIGAACRTYNFLASEGRKVVAAILL